MASMNMGTVTYIALTGMGGTSEVTLYADTVGMYVLAMDGYTRIPVKWVERGVSVVRCD